MNKEQLTNERNRLTEARARLEKRSRAVELRLAEIDKEHLPALIRFAASGNLAEVQELEAEKVRLLVALQAPYLAAHAEIDNRTKTIRLALDRIVNIERRRTEDAEFAKYFNGILQRRTLQADDEERLLSYASGSPAFKKPVRTLIQQLQEFNFKGFGANPIPFEQIVTVQPLSEEIDSSEITVNA